MPSVVAPSWQHKNNISVVIYLKKRARTRSLPKSEASEEDIVSDEDACVGTRLQELNHDFWLEGDDDDDDDGEDEDASD
jgi:hypothetical protein